MGSRDVISLVTEAIYSLRMVCIPGIPNERIYQAVRVHHYTPREVGDCVGVLCSTIGVIAKRVQKTIKS